MPITSAARSWLAVNRQTGEIVASALLACDGPLDTAEIAMSVCADHRGKGVGWAMLDFLAHQAQARGVRRVISIEDRDNHAAIELEREKGVRAAAGGRRSDAGDAVQIVPLNLSRIPLLWNGK
ncbi:GNAT family N-acetyltransferase [Novosphingobium colocasiae]